MTANVEPYQEKLYKPRLSCRPWEVTFSPGEWPLGSRLTMIDVSATLKLGYFDNGMRLKNIKTRSVYTVTMVGDVQVLRNSRYFMIQHNSGLRRVTPAEMVR